MGYTLPATIGAKLGKPEKQVIGLAGDGEFLMSLEELHTGDATWIKYCYGSLE